MDKERKLPEVVIKNWSERLKESFSEFSLELSEEKCADGKSYTLSDDAKEFCINILPLEEGWEFWIVRNWSNPHNVQAIQADSIEKLAEKYYS